MSKDTDDICSEHLEIVLMEIHCKKNANKIVTKIINESTQGKFDCHIYGFLSTKTNFANTLNKQSDSVCAKDL